MIASGLKFYGVDDIYIDEEILGVLYLRNRKPSEYLIFPHAASVIPPKCHCASGTKLTKEEKKKVEKIVNEKIRENLEIVSEEMPYEEAVASGALAFFKEKYPKVVKVYTIRNPKTGEIYSKEVCAGPHVKSTGEIGIFKIKSEKSSGAEVRRIKAILT